MARSKKNIYSAEFFNNFWSKITPVENGCWEWSGARQYIRPGFISSGGYGTMHSENTLIKAHRVAWVLSFGEIPNGYFVCHKCDNPPCCYPGHLFLGTPKDNQVDMRKKHRGADINGSKNPMKKLTDEQIQSIINTPYSWHRLRDLSAKYGVNYRHIWRILKGNRWAHIKRTNPYTCCRKTTAQINTN